MNIYFQKNDIDTVIREKKRIRKWIKAVIRNEGKQSDTINIILTGNKEIKALNRKYLKRNYLTDIIAFNYNRENIIAGDLYICTETIRDNAKELRVSFSAELKRVIIHGVLHLIGYNDKYEKEKKEIREREDFYLKLFNDIT